MRTHRGWIATTLLVGAGVVTAVACGPAAKSPAVPAGGPTASSSAPAVAAVPADGTVVHIEFEAGGCSVLADDSQGTSYKAAPGAEPRVADSISAALKPCFASGPGRHGLLHVSVAVRADGSAASPMAAPGGALANEVESCVAKAMGSVKLPAPERGDGVLLLLITSTCPEN